LKWIVNGTWITKYKSCLNCVISILSKGIYYSNKQSFANIPNIINLINMEGKEIINETLSEFIKLKVTKKNSVALNLQNSKVTNKDGISTSTEDGGVGVPTFALLSSALMIETVSEVCLNKILNYYGIFPPYGNNTSICNLGSLWREDDELFELIKLKYSEDKKLQFYNKTKEEIIQSFLEQEEDNIIQYYSFNNEFIIGVLSLPSWYVNIKKDKYLKNNKPVIKSISTTSGITSNKYNQLKNSNSEIIKKISLSDKMEINNNSQNQLTSKECCSPEHVVLFEYDNPNLQYHPLVRKQSETSLYELTMESPKKIKDDNNSEEKNPDCVENNISSTKKNNDEEDKGLNVPPESQSNRREKDVFHSEKNIKNIDEKYMEYNALSINSIIENEELKENFVAYIVRNYTGKYTWISSLKYENNNDILQNIINSSKMELVNSTKNNSTESLDNNTSTTFNINIPHKYYNSVSNIRLTNEFNNKFDNISKERKSIFETNVSKDNIEECCGKSKEFKILNCTCFNEIELPNNNDIINDENRKSYNKIEKI